MGGEAVTRGKYAAKAERRSEFAEIEQRAISAEAARDKAEAALASYRGTAEGEIARLKERLADTMAQRDAGTSPQITDLEARVEELRRQRKDAEAAQAEKLKVWRQFADGFRQYLVRVNGLTNIEAHEIMLNCFPGKEQATYVTAKNTGPRVDHAVGAARGWRHAADILPEVFGQLKDDPE
jgi:hypothetical protein